MFKAALVYWSKTGNTLKVAEEIASALKDFGISVDMMNISQDDNVDFFDYDLICIGIPSYHWHPPKQVDTFLRNKFKQYQKEGKVKLAAPKVEGKNAVIFCTYSGPHTGINEAIPVGKYIGQFFEHIGFNVLDEWYVLSEFQGSEENSTKGKMGDIRELPNEKQLAEIRTKTQEIAQTISST